MTDEKNIDMNDMIRAAAGRTLPAEDEEPAATEDQSKRPGTANAGVRPLPAPEPDMNEEIRRAVSRSRYGHAGETHQPLPR